MTNAFSADVNGLSEQWCSGMAECFCCEHTWIAVWPLGAEALECPECGSVDTDRTAE